MWLILAAFALGAITSFSMSPYDFWPATFIGLSLLFIIIHHTHKMITSILIVYGYYFGYMLFSLSWIANALLIENNPYTWAWPIALIGLPLILGLYTIVPIYAYKKIQARFDLQSNLTANYLLFSAAIFTVQISQSLLLTGFPWNLFGYTWISILPIAQIAGIGNIYLLTAITILWAILPAYIYLTHHKKKALSILIVTFIAAYTYGANKIDSFHANNTRDNDYAHIIVQPNIAQADKSDYSKTPQHFRRHLILSQYKQSTSIENTKKKAYYIIWPESAVPLAYLNTPHIKATLKKTLESYPSPAYLITGSARYDKQEDNYYNSIITFNANMDIIDTYDKRHLVPFGEYMPFEDIINMMPIANIKGFTKGKTDLIQTFPEGTRYLPLICYEIIFPQYVHNQQSDVIINVTNDAWYGDSAGPYQHLTQARFRAIESHTTILRSANTGISAIINAAGEVESSLQLFETGIINTSIH